MEVGDAFSYGAICTTTDLPPPGCEIISPNDRLCGIAELTFKVLIHGGIIIL